MKYVFYALMGMSFAGAFAIGFFTKRWWSLVLSLLLGALMSAASFFIALGLPSIQKAGFAIIALIPVLAVIAGVMNIPLSLIGGIIGTFIGKRKIRPQSPP